MWGRLYAASGADAGRRSERARVGRRGSRRSRCSCATNAEALIVRGDGDREALSHAAREVLEQIERRGAPFFAEIARGTKRLPSEVEEALWQLVAAGLVTADGFDALALAERRKAAARREGLARAAALVGRPLDAAAGERGAIDRRRVRAPAAGALGRRVPRRRSRARRSRRHGANCSVRCGAWKRAARFAAADSSRASSANSLHCPKRSTRCARPPQPRSGDRRSRASDPLQLGGVILPGPRRRLQPAS